MVNLIGYVPRAEDVLRIPGARLHLYGKESRPGRKLGHVTLVEPTDEAEAALRGAVGEATSRAAEPPL
jgi:5-(carboxyamino)imidazole ribonucleotide synthase